MCSSPTTRTERDWDWAPCFVIIGHQCGQLPPLPTAEAGRVFDSSHRPFFADKQLLAADKQLLVKVALQSPCWTGFGVDRRLFYGNESGSVCAGVVSRPKQCTTTLLNTKPDAVLPMNATSPLTHALGRLQVRPWLDLSSRSAGVRGGS
jgi:hypothetical protein